MVTNLSHVHQASFANFRVTYYSSTAPEFEFTLGLSVRHVAQLTFGDSVVFVDMRSFLSLFLLLDQLEDLELIGRQYFLDTSRADFTDRSVVKFVRLPSTLRRYVADPVSLIGQLLTRAPNKQGGGRPLGLLRVSVSD